MNIYVLFTAFMALLTLTACEKPASEQAAAKQLDSALLARVGDSEVSEFQLTAMLDKFANNLPQQELAQIEDVVLQGLVRTRALALLTEQQLSQSERQLLDARVQNYRDELLVQAYIRKNIEPRPVTPEMVRSYYEQNIDQFTLPGKLRFEYLVTTESDLNDSQLAGVMDAMISAKSRRDWQQFAAYSEQEKLPLSYRSGYMPLANVDKTLQPHLARLEPGDISDLVFADYIYLLRLQQRDPDSVKPLHEVSNNIRKKLAPEQLKQTLALHIDEAVNKVGIEYLK